MSGERWDNRRMVPATAPRATSAAGEVRVGAIDCGTNSLRLLIADIDPQTGKMLELSLIHISEPTRPY